MLLIFVSPLMRFPFVARPPVLHDQLAKTIVGSAIDAAIALPFEGKRSPTSEILSWLLTDGELVLSGFELYRKQYDQSIKHRRNIFINIARGK